MASCIFLIGVATRIFAVLRLADNATLLRFDALLDERTVSGDKLSIEWLLRRDALFDESNVRGDTLFSDAVFDDGAVTGGSDVFSILRDILYIIYN